MLTPLTTRQRCLGQILPGHTACSQLAQLSGWRVTAAAYSQARARRLRRFFDLLLERCSHAVPHSALDDGRWHGHRTVLVDGSGCSMPDTPARQIVDCTPGRPFVRPSVRRTPAVKSIPRSRWLNTLGLQDHLVA